MNIFFCNSLQAKLEYDAFPGESKALVAFSSTADNRKLSICNSKIGCFSFVKKNDTTSSRNLFVVSVFKFLLLSTRGVNIARIKVDFENSHVDLELYDATVHSSM